MKTQRITSVLVCALLLTQAYSQNSRISSKTSTSVTETHYKFSASTAYHTFLNFGEVETNTQHYEFHFGYRLTPKDKIGIKVATWKLFATMGMPMAEQLKFSESNFYPGRLRESGMGVSYQRLIWKGLFASVEILPLFKTYIDENDKKIGKGFKLYTSYHLGYHISLFNNRMFIEPQIHCNYWPIDTKAPQGFKEIDQVWNNYFLFEPNLHIGINF